MDWNWFFSSFCQSAAALIGIIGAFVISRLLGLTEKINSLISEFERLLIEESSIKAKISKRKFYWYTKTSIRYDDDLKAAIRKGEYEHLNLNREKIIEKIFNSQPKLFIIEDAAMEAFNELYEANNPNAIHNLLADFPSVSLGDRLNSEKEAINQVEIEAKTIIRKFNNNLEELNSFDNTINPLKVIIILLMIAFPITVIYPLDFMPLSTNENPSITFNILAILNNLFSIKASLLLAFFVIIEVIFNYFLRLTNELNNKITQTRKRNSFDLRNIKSYSKYFEDKE